MRRGKKKPNQLFSGVTTGRRDTPDVWAVIYSIAPGKSDTTCFQKIGQACAVCLFCQWVTQGPFTANSIKALGTVLIGLLYFWLSTSPVLLPLRNSGAANVKQCDNRAIRHSTEFDPTSGVHDRCETIPSLQLSKTQKNTLFHSLLFFRFSHIFYSTLLLCQSAAPVYRLAPRYAPVGRLFEAAAIITHHCF